MLHKLFFFALIFTLTLNSNSFAQTYQFAWIGEMGLGSPNVETGLDSAVQFIQEAFLPIQKRPSWKKQNPFWINYKFLIMLFPGTMIQNGTVAE